MTTYIDLEDVKPGINAVFDDMRDQIKKLDKRTEKLEQAFVSLVVLINKFYGIQTEDQI